MVENSNLSFKTNLRVWCANDWELREAPNWINTRPVLENFPQQKGTKFGFLAYWLHFFKAHQFFKLNEEEHENLHRWNTQQISWETSTSELYNIQSCRWSREYDGSDYKISINEGYRYNFVGFFLNIHGVFHQKTKPLNINNWLLKFSDCFRRKTFLNRNWPRKVFL